MASWRPFVSKAAGMAAGQRKRSEPAPRPERASGEAPPTRHSSLSSESDLKEGNDRFANDVTITPREVRLSYYNRCVYYQEGIDHMQYLGS